MQDDEDKEKYLTLFNKITDACALMEQACDTCVVMQAVPEYDPAKEPLCKQDKRPQKPKPE